MPITPKVQARIPIPEPTNEPDSLWRTCQALKEAVEVMQGIRGNREYALKAELSAGTTTINNLSGLNNVVEDLTPQLGGNLDLNLQHITGTAGAATVDIAAGISTITLAANQFWSFTGPGNHYIKLDAGGAAQFKSTDNTTTVTMDHGNTNFTFSVTGTRFDTIPFQIGGFLDLRLNQPIKMKEQATADPFVATYGQLWVKTATPNELWFSDDAGTDFQLSGGTGLGNVVEDLTPQLGGELDAQAFAVLDFTIKHQVVSSAATVLTVDYALGQSVLTTLTENIATFTINNWPATDLAQIEFEIIQDGVARTVAWPAAVEWIGGVAPDLSNLSSRNLVRLRTRNGGTNIMGTFGENFS